jgi:hypothetical protein
MVKNVVKIFPHIDKNKFKNWILEKLVKKLVKVVKIVKKVVKVVKNGTNFSKL